MKRILIGHRGVGKSSLLQRHLTYFPNVTHIDLDSEIEKKTKLSVTDFFAKFSEDAFRKLEIETYREIKMSNQNYVIASGAGFPIKEIDLQDEVIFVSRVTDSDGRIFLNRPRLNQDMSALQESKSRFLQRDLGYRNRANFIYHLSEGVQDASATEKRILSFRFRVYDGIYTLAESELPDILNRMQNFAKIELRTDLISKADILKIVQLHPKHDWLVSFRTEEDIELPNSVEVDCDVRFFKKQNIQILSSHEKSIEKALNEVRPFESRFHIKLCPVIENFSDLKRGLQWQQQSPTARSFLPRSETGKWNWFRLLSKYTQKLNFVRNQNEQPDQPSLYQWLGLPATRPKQWAAIVGYPVYFSRSPIRHEEFFQKQNSFMCAIPMSANEFRAEIFWLQELGLAYLAVTAPLKQIAFEMASHKTAEAQELNSVNTIRMSKNQIHGHNTDLAGFQSLQLTDSKNIAVWGGGGTLQMIKKVLPQATCFSSQTGKDREKDSGDQSYSTLVWAAPRNDKTLLPPPLWPVKMVVDLNYSENSMGLEYAQKLISAGNEIVYISGLKMFNEQARQQQEFWSLI